MSDLMENRRLQGKDGINKKLKGNQEFLYKNTLSPEAPIWTKWHQNRLLESEMTKDFSNAPNAKYMSVSDVHNPRFFQLYLLTRCSKLRLLKGSLVKINLSSMIGQFLRLGSKSFAAELPFFYASLCF